MFIHTQAKLEVSGVQVVKSFKPVIYWCLHSWCCVEFVWLVSYSRYIQLDINKFLLLRHGDLSAIWLSLSHSSEWIQVILQAHRNFLHSTSKIAVVPVAVHSLSEDFQDLTMSWERPEEKLRTFWMLYLDKHVTEKLKTERTAL